MSYTFQLGVALDQLPLLLEGALITLQLALLGFWGGALIGVLGATAKTFGGPVARAIAGAYVTFFTNTPALLQIYFFYFGLPELGILLSSFVSVLLGLTLNAGAYLTEIMRAGFVSVRRTELEAAETLGFTLPQQVRYVILPQASRIAIAPTVGFSVQVIKGTALASIIGFALGLLAGMTAFEWLVYLGVRQNRFANHSETPLVSTAEDRAPPAANPTHS